MTLTVALAGPPNAGKTTLFNRLTRAHAKVGNYAGVTVERLEGRARLPRLGEVAILDVPGITSLSARSQEELVALEEIVGLRSGVEPDVVVVVVDGTQLQRHLYLVLQVLELRERVVVALNMGDVLERHAVRVDAEALAEALGVPVVPISAVRGEGIDALREAIADVARCAPGAPAPSNGHARPGLPADGPLAADIDAVCAALPQRWRDGGPRRARALAAWALMSVDADDELLEVPAPLREAVEARRARAAAAGRDLELELARSRYAWIDARRDAFLTGPLAALRRLSDAVDRVLVHPVLGLALLLLVLALVFEGLFTWSAPLIDAVDAAVGATGAAVGAWLPDGMLRDFVVDGLFAGVGAVLVFLPQILMLFLFLGLLEDSGYMARAALLMDRLMRSLGLTGRAFVPMLGAYACAIPAIMATRTMERQRDRLLTILVLPLMTCSARLPVYTLVIAALFPAPDAPGGRWLGLLSVQSLLMVAMYVFSTVMALLVAAVLSRTLFKARARPLVLELPPYRLPHAPTVLRMMWQRGTLFVTEAGTVILVCTLVLWALLTFPRGGAAVATAPPPPNAATAAADADGTPAAASDVDAAAPSDPAAHRTAPAIDAPAIGAAASAPLDAGVLDPASQRLRGSWGGQLGRWLEPAIAPLGFDWKIGIGLLGAFAAREVFVSTMGVVYGVGDDATEESATLREHLRGERRGDGSAVYTPLVGLSLMVFFALACQCMSTLAVVRRETRSWRWPLAMFAYMTLLAWGASFVVFQGGRLLGFA